MGRGGQAHGLEPSLPLLFVPEMWVVVYYERRAVSGEAALLEPGGCRDTREADGATRQVLWVHGRESAELRHNTGCAQPPLVPLGFAGRYGPRAGEGSEHNQNTTWATLAMGALQGILPWVSQTQGGLAEQSASAQL